MKLLTVMAVGVSLAASLPAQLLKNINEMPQALPGTPTDSFPQELVEAGGRLYFSASNGTTGREYYWIDGTGGPAQLLADVAPGSDGSNPTELVELGNGLLVFVADTPQYGRELWVSDGTSAGTSLLADLTGPGEHSLIQQLVVHQGLCYFLGRSSGNFSLSLWVTDGTTAGTLELDSLNLTGSFSGQAQMLVSTGTDLFFTTSETNGNGVWRLYKSDGQIGGAQLVTSVPEPNWYGPRELTALPGGVVCVAQTIGTGLEIFVSDGTAAGSTVVDLIPGPDGSNPSDLTVVGSHVFFAAYESFISGEVFVTDGTVAGTTQVTSSIRNGARPLWMRPWNGLLAYCGDDGVHGPELWVAAPAVGSEFLFADIVPGPTGGVPQEMVPFGNGMMFMASTPATGSELFFSAGPSTGATLVRDIFPGTDHSTPNQLTTFAGQVVFAADDQVQGNELFVSDGTAMGTVVRADLASSAIDQSSYVRGLVDIGDRAVFSADDGLAGQEIWVTDGTAAGTVQLTDFNGNEDSVPFGLWYGSKVGGRAFFQLDDGVHGVEPWVTDGTQAGTYMLADLRPGGGDSEPIPLIEWRGELYFAARTTGSFTWDLYATDGSPTGTRLVYSWGFGGFNNTLVVDRMLEHDGRLYFAARSSAHGLELWSTDGTTAGTSLFFDIFPGTASGLFGLEGISANGYLYFAATDATGDTELWRTDGTAAGTGLFMDLNPASDSWPAGFYRIGDRIVFDAFVNGDWRYMGSDGVTVEQLTSAPLDLNGNWRLHSNGEKLIGMLRGANASFELWGTDGTAAGSGVIQQIWPDHTQFVNFRAWPINSGPKLLFLARNAAAGAEVWVTDGTTAGTQLYRDVNPGPGGSNPDEMVRIGNSLIFNASEPATGFELYRLPFDQLDGWVNEPFGHGCPGTSGDVPLLDTSGSATLGDTLAIELSRCAASAPILHYWSDQYAFLSLGACEIYLDAPNFVASTTSDPAGASTLPIAFPNQPALVGQSIWLQSLSFDFGGPFFGLGALTPAIEIRVGN